MRTVLKGYENGSRRHREPFSSPARKNLFKDSLKAFQSLPVVSETFSTGKRGV